MTTDEKYLPYAAEIISALELDLQRKIKVYPHRTNWASSLAHPCLRNLVYWRTKAELASPHSPEMQVIFDEGNVHETAVYRRLMDAGIVIIEQQRPFDWKRYEIAGRIDGKVKIKDKIFPMELKSMSPNSWYSIRTIGPFKGPFVLGDINDLRHHDKYYVRGYYGQIQLYMLMDNKEEGLIVLKNKSNGQLKFLFTELDYEYAEKLIQKAEAVNEHVKKGTLPDRMEFDPDVCNDCPFRHICNPEEQFQDVEVETDPEVIQMLERLEELKPYKKEYDEIRKILKERLKEKEKVLIGDFLVTGKWVTRKGYTVPEMTYWDMKIKRIK